VSKILVRQTNNLHLLTMTLVLRMDIAVADARYEGITFTILDGVGNAGVKICIRIPVDLLFAPSAMDH
jgi:hypothetical protein